MASSKFSSSAADFLRGFEPAPPLARKLLVVHGDIWNMHRSGDKIVVTTNVGWDPETLRNNMGAGLALEAQMRWPDLSRWYGKFCREHGAATPVVERADRGLIFFPVKPLLDPDDPERSWDQRASLATIEKSLSELVKLDGPISLTFPGCGNGGLDVARVAPLLERYLRDDRFTVVDRAAPTARTSGA